jgi:hypothetical protein
LEEKQLENVVIKNLLRVTSIAIILTKQYSGMDIFSSNHYFAYGIGDSYANPSSFFIDLQGNGQINIVTKCSA